MEYVRKRRRVFFAIAAVTLPLIVIVGPEYGNLQTAEDAEAFRSIASDDTWRYVAAGLIDLVFAAAYGLAALGVASAPGMSRTSRTSLIGGWLVALGAAADEAENVTLLVGVNRRASLGDGAVDLMRGFGAVKWTSILAGLALLFAGYLWTRRALLRDWIDRAGRPYLIFLALVVLMVPVAYFRLPSGVLAVALVALAYAGSKLNDAVRKDRDAANPPPGGSPPGTDHGPARTMLAALQLVIGVALAWFGYRFDGGAADIAYFLGVALVVMSLGAFVSELRQSGRFRPARGVVLLLASLALLAIAAMADRGSSPMLVPLGVVLGWIGTELLSADYLRWSPPFPSWVVGASGFVVLLVGVSLFVAAGVDPGHAVLVVAALAVIVFFASADGDALIIVFLVALALVWATSPVAAKVDDERRPDANEPYFVVFGDSYISGEGAETFIEGTNEKVHDPDPNAAHTNECRQATTAWPFVVAEMAAADAGSSLPSRVLFLACSGAVSENIHTEARKDRNGKQHGSAELKLFLDQKEALGLGDPAFVVLSIGGNDAGFGDIGQTCVAPGNCAEVGDQFLRSPRREAADQSVEGAPGPGRPEALKFIDDDLDATYKRVKKAVGDGVPIVVVPYPIPLTETGRCRGVLLDEDERRFIRGFVPQLNGVIRDVATRNGLYYLDGMEDALRVKGAQLCSKVGGRAGLNFLALNPTSGSLADSLSPKNWVHNSLHPNADGHRALAEAAYGWLATNMPPKAAPAPPDEPFEVAPITAVLRGAFVSQCDEADRATCVVDGGVWVGEQVHNFFARSFFPLAVVMFGLWLCINPMLRWGGSRRPPVTVASLIWPGLRDAGAKVWAGLRWLWRGP